MTNMTSIILVYTHGEQTVILEPIVYMLATENENLEDTLIFVTLLG